VPRLRNGARSTNRVGAGEIGAIFRLERRVGLEHARAREAGGELHPTGVAIPLVTCCSSDATKTFGVRPSRRDHLGTTRRRGGVAPSLRRRHSSTVRPVIDDT